MASSSKLIRDLNDRFRKGDPTIPGRTMITSGVQMLIADHQCNCLEDLITAVRDYDDFTSDNDPYREHDFGAFDFLSERLFLENRLLCT